MDHAIQKATENAHVATYTGTGTTAVLWGLHANEWCMIVSTGVAVLGFALQIYLAIRRR